MKTSRQDYKDGDYESALKASCDSLQLKYDGWWCRVEITNGQGQCFSETGRHLPKFDFQLTTQPLNATLIGELMYGTQWSKDPNRYGKVFLFDCWQIDDVHLEERPYKERFGIARATKPFLPSNFELVQNFKIQNKTEVWKAFVETEQFEGVVYRNSHAAAGLPVYREKFSFTQNLKVVGFRQGQGKHEGRLGALLCIDSAGVPTDVGGGFDDALREEVWKDPDLFHGRWLQVEAKKKFESGSLRHPNFLSWRPEGWTP